MKRYKLYCIVAVALVILGTVCSLSVAADAPKTSFVPEKNLLLIGWDGVLWDDLQALLKGGHLPNLASLKASGALVHIAIKDHETCTKPGWTQICTGLSAKTSGVFSNSDFRPFPKGATIFEKLEELSDHRIFTSFIAGKAHHLGSLGPGIDWKDQIIGTGNTLSGEPWMNAKGTFDVWYGDKNREAKEVYQSLLKVLQDFSQHNRFALFAHFADPDENGHKFGEGSPEYMRAIMLCDSELGKIQDRLRDYGLENDTVVVVVTDHGFDKGQKHHFNAPDAFFAVNDSTHHYHDGNMTDIAPTMLQLLDVPKETYQKLPGEALWQ